MPPITVTSDGAMHLQSNMSRKRDGGMRRCACRPARAFDLFEIKCIFLDRIRRGIQILRPQFYPENLRRPIRRLSPKFGGKGANWHSRLHASRWSETIKSQILRTQFSNGSVVS